MASNQDRVREQVRKWRDDLVNLNRRNRLLYFKHTKTSSVEIGAPACNEIMSLLNSRPGRLDFYLPVPEVPGTPSSTRPPAKNEAVCRVWKGTAADGELRDATSSDLSKILRGLDRQARAEFMDRGLQSLYLGMGLLQWIDPKFPSDVNVGPLILVPVELERSGPGEPYRLVRSQDDLVLNPALQLKLENDFGVTLPALDDESDCDEYFARVRGVVRRQPGWEVRPVTVLARFSFLKEVMYRDLLEHEDEICAHPLVRALASPVGSPSDFDFEPVEEADLDQVAVDTTLLCIRDADATQRACIWAAREGRTFVMDGPPGTGKSQTIANMIAELIGNARSVLFVSEKAAALEVVHSRLRECGLDEYVLQLHSHKATRREVAKQLSASVSRRPSMDGQLSDTERADLHKKRQRLGDYAAAMNEVREPLGLNLFDAIGRVAGLHHVYRPAARADIAPDLSASQFATILSAAKDLQRAWGPVEREASFVWRDLSVGRVDAARRAEVGELLGLMIQANHAVESRLEEARTELRGWDPGKGAWGLRSVKKLLEAVADARESEASWLEHEDFGDLIAAVNELGELLSRYDEQVAASRKAAGADADQAEILRIASEYSEVVALCSSAGNWTPDPGWTLSQLRETSSRCGQLVGLIRDEVSGTLSELVAATGITGFDSSTLSEARDLCDLLAMAESPERPEAEWLSLARLSELKHAQPVLASLVTAMREKRQRIEEVFKPGAMDLDADGLYQRFTQVHVGVKRVSIGYLKDRKALAAVSRTGKFSQSYVEMLPTVVELQKLSADLAAFERDESQVVGSYYRGEETDLERLDRAIHLAEDALHIVERRIGLSKALKSVALNADVDPHVLLVARRLRTTIDSLIGQADELRLDEQSMSSLVIGELLEYVERVAAAAACWAEFGGNFDSGPTAEAMSSCGLAAIEVGNLVTLEETVRPRLEALIGAAYLGLDTDIASLRSRTDRASVVRDALGTNVPYSVGERVLGNTLDLTATEAELARWENLGQALRELFEEDRAQDLMAQLDADSGEASRLLSLMTTSLDDIDEWIAFAESRTLLASFGLEATVDACIAERIPQSDVAAAIERVVLETWIDGIVDADQERLSPFRAKDRQALRREFVELDKRLVRSAAGRVMKSCNARRPSKSVGAVGIILREGEKKTRHMPIRTLLEKTKAEAQAIKPCFMMSPLSVSQFLPSDLRFDVVLFDEASQIRPHDAINCVYRGSQHIIAGDQQQLPPTSFFDGVRDDGDDVWDEEELESFESVLDVAKSCASIPSLPLRWHYRSRHEDLITYSNVSFYDASLISFPAPHVKAPTLGVGFNKVDGVYRRGTGTPNDNPMEARAVANLVAHYAKNYPKLTLGVVAFSSAQEEAIENAIDQLRIEDPSLPKSYFDAERLDGFFVKNLETVQGDERDVIILSIGYGRDAAGKILMNFGPINQAGGYRRLNVAVTRARMRLELVTSITAADISAASENDGVRHMKRYLDYAEHGPSVLAVGDGRSLGDVESPFEAEVARVIRSWGYDVVTQVGTAGYRIDLALVHPDQPGRLCLAIECDGAAYHASKVARDRDRLRDEVLKGLGWRIHRIWGTAWYRQRDLAEISLRDAIEAAIRDCDAPTSRQGSRESAKSIPVIKVEDVAVEDGFVDEDWIVDYAVHVPKLSALDRRVPMGDRSASPIMQRELPGIVKAESPIHRDVAVDRLKEAWDTKRAGHNIMSEFDSALRYCQRAGHVDSDERGFLWAPGKKTVKKARRPVAGDARTNRTCSLVSPEEYDFAVSRVLQSVNTIGESQLHRNVASVFGWERVGADIRSQIESAVTRVIEADSSLEGRIVHDDDLPRAQNGSRPRSAAPATKAKHRNPQPQPDRVQTKCPICGYRFGDHSKPTELTFYENGSPAQKTVHLSCAENVRSGRKKLSRYQWDAARGGLVQVGESRSGADDRPSMSHDALETHQPRAVGWDPETNTPVIE